MAGNLTRSSSPWSDAQIHPSPTGSCAKVSNTSFAWSRSALPSTQALIAFRSCGEVTPRATRVESWVSTSLFSFAGRWVIEMRRKPKFRPRRAMRSTSPKTRTSSPMGCCGAKASASSKTSQSESRLWVKR